MYLLLYIFMKNDSVKKPLQPPYNGPLLVLNWTDKHFTLDMAGKKRVVSLDQLKLAYMDTTLPSTDYNSATKYVRTVHLPIPPQLLRISHQNLQLPQLHILLSNLPKESSIAHSPSSSLEGEHSGNTHTKKKIQKPSERKLIK